MSDLRTLIYQIEQHYSNPPADDQDILEIYQTILDMNQDLYPLVDGNLIHLAAKHADAAAIHYLIGRGLNPAETDMNKNTALHALAQENNYKPRDDQAIKACTELLLDQRVSPLRKNSSGECCYHVAARNAVAAMIEVMAERGCKLDMINSSADNILHIAATYAHSDVSAINLQNQANQRRQQAEQHLARFESIAAIAVTSNVNPFALNSNNQRAIDIAVEGNCKLMAVIMNGQLCTEDADHLTLLIQAGGKTLHQAIKSNDREAVQALIELGSDLDEVWPEVPFAHQTPLAVALMNMNIELIRMIITAGAQVNFKTGEEGRSALYFMVKYCHYPVAYYQEKRLQTVLNLLIEAGYDINDTVDDLGNTAVNCATGPLIGMTTIFSYGSFQDLVIQTWIDKGADVNLANAQGRTPLMNFCDDVSMDKENECLALLEAGADPSLQDAQGNTALMLLAASRNFSSATAYADLLASFGDVMINAENNDGQSALAIATQRQNESLVQWILERM